MKHLDFDKNYHLTLVENTSEEDTTRGALLTAILDQIGIAKVLEFVADYAHAQADAIRDGHKTSNLENDLAASLKMVNLRQLADHLETPISHAITNLE